MSIIDNTYFNKTFMQMLNLRDVKLLSWLTNSELYFLESISQKRSLKTGEILFNNWDEASALYVLLEWKLESYISDDIILWEIYAEDIVWEMWIFSDEKIRMSSVRVKKDSVVLVILAFAIDTLKEKHPEIIWKILNIIEERKKNNKWKIL